MVKLIQKCVGLRSSSKRFFAGPGALSKMVPPSAEWARAHPERALRLLFIHPQDGAWLDEVISEKSEHRS